jgi:hypothetical protein
MKDNEKHEIDIQERMDKAYELAKKWKIGILDSPKGSGRWQVYFTDPNTKKQVHLFKTKNGEPLHIPGRSGHPFRGNPDTYSI